MATRQRVRQNRGTNADALIQILDQGIDKKLDDAAFSHLDFGGYTHARGKSGVFPFHQQGFLLRMNVNLVHQPQVFILDAVLGNMQQFAVNNPVFLKMKASIVSESAIAGSRKPT